MEFVLFFRRLKARTAPIDLHRLRLRANDTGRITALTRRIQIGIKPPGFGIIIVCSRPQRLPALDAGFFGNSPRLLFRHRARGGFRTRRKFTVGASAADRRAVGADFGFLGASCETDVVVCKVEFVDGESED